MSEVSVLSSDPVVISAGERSPNTSEAPLPVIKENGSGRNSSRHSFDPEKHNFVAWILRLFGRDFVQAWFVRGSISMIPFTIRIIKSGKDLGVLEAIVGAYGNGSIRFGLFVASFFAIFKIAECKNMSTMVSFIKKTLGLDIDEGWLRSGLAGAIASMALVFEGSEETRWMFAQYAAVRAGQCVYEHARTKFKPLADIGDWLYTGIFAISSGQLVYSFAMRPDTLDREYNSFLNRVTHMPLTVVQAVRDNLHENWVNYQAMDKVVSKYYPDGLPSSQIHIALRSSPGVIDCHLMHPETSSCAHRIFSMWPFIFRIMFPVYGSLHTFPALAFGPKRVLASPISFLQACLKNTVRSSSFMATYIAIFQTLLCAHRGLFRRGFIQKDHKALYWLFGFISASSVLIEKKSRRIELALYLLPKAIVTVIRAFKSKVGKDNWTVPAGDLWLFSASMAIIMVSVRAPCCRRWFDCPQCHAEASDHQLQKTAEIVLACKKCTKVFRKDSTEGVEESDEYCPYCDNHYVIAAVEPTQYVTLDGNDPRFMQQDARMKPKDFVIPDDELLDLMSY